MIDVTSTNLAYLRGLKKLRILNLTVDQQPAIVDEGLVHLAGLTALEELDLFSQEVSDAGLEHLKGLPALCRLDVRSTKVTEKGIERLKASLPQLKVKGP